MEVFQSFIETITSQGQKKINIVCVSIKEGSHTKIAGYHYCPIIDEKGHLSFYINQLDKWSWTSQPSAVNVAEKIIENIIEQEKLEELYSANDVEFKIVYKKANAMPSFSAEYIKPKTTLFVSMLKMDDWKARNIDFVKGRGEELLLEDVARYTSISECEKEFNMVKLFVNSIAKKVEKEKKALNQDIFAYANIKEQKFYDWKKSNPELIRAITFGDIINSLATVPSLLYSTWNTDEVMTYPNGQEM